MYLLLKNWWSKLSRRFRNLNVGRTFKAQSSSKIHVLSKSYDNLNEEESSDSQFSEISSSNDSGVTLRSLTSGMLELSIAISVETMRTRNIIDSHPEKLHNFLFFTSKVSMGIFIEGG